jgi:hypothetical protein
MVRLVPAIECGGGKFLPRHQPTCEGHHIFGRVVPTVLLKAVLRGLAIGRNPLRLDLLETVEDVIAGQSGRYHRSPPREEWLGEVDTIVIVALERRSAPSVLNLSNSEPQRHRAVLEKTVEGGCTAGDNRRGPMDGVDGVGRA